MTRPTTSARDYYGHFVPPPASFASPTVVRNATVPSEQRLQLCKLWTPVVRQGCMEFRRYASKGLGC